MRRLRQAGAGKVLLVGAPEESRGFLAALAGERGLPEILPASPLGGLAETLLAVSRCRLFVGHDSGPLHCAAGFGVPVLGLYLPGDWPRTRPQGAGPWRALRRPAAVEADPAEAAALAGELLRAPMR